MWLFLFTAIPPSTLPCAHKGLILGFFDYVLGLPSFPSLTEGESTWAAYLPSAPLESERTFLYGRELKKTAWCHYQKDMMASLSMDGKCWQIYPCNAGPSCIPLCILNWCQQWWQLYVVVCKQEMEMRCRLCTASGKAEGKKSTVNLPSIITNKYWGF